MKFKKFLPSIVLAFATSFMLFIYEPIVLYANNVNDFWFDLYVMLKPTLLAFAICFIVIVAILIILQVIFEKFKRPKIFHYLLILLFACFVCAYIHGNFLAGFLPSLNGETIVWGEMVTENIISIIVCIIIIGGAIFVAIKYDKEMVIKWANYTTLAVLTLLLISTITTLFTTPALEEKEIVTYATAENINTASKNKNFMILLVDAVDSYRFSNEVKNDPEYLDAFQDFTYYPDTVSAYGLTRDSIPFIFSGIWNRNETDFTTYSTNAYNNSPLFEKLKANNYDMNFYDEDFVWHDRNALEFTNIKARVKEVNLVAFVKQELKYDLFKYLPYPLKRFSRIESLDFLNTQVLSEDAVFNWYDTPNYQNLTTEKLSLQDQNYFQFLHVEGSHVPYDIDENFNKIENGTYEIKCHATLKLIKAYMDRLKEAGVYDNSIVMVMADHGYSGKQQNPILYIKGYSEHHDLYTSDKAIWYQDLNEAYEGLLAGRKSTELFADIENSGRTRIMIYNGWKTEEHMIEYEQKGKAWEKETLQPTGKVYDL